MLNKFFAKTGLILAMFALLGNLALPAFAVSHGGGNPALQSTQEVSGVPGKVMICTITGVKWVSLQDLQSGNAPETSQKPHNCPLCSISGIGMAAFQPLGGTFVLWAPMRSHLLVRVAHQDAHPHLTPSKIKLTRAPPRLFVLS